jgi:hypothetical protein
MWSSSFFTGTIDDILLFQVKLFLSGYDSLNKSEGLQIDERFFFISLMPLERNSDWLSLISR